MSTEDVAVISWDDRGFWHSDIYFGASGWTDGEWNSGCSPDDFGTNKDRAVLEKQTREVYPGIEIREADDTNELER